LNIGLGQIPYMFVGKVYLTFFHNMINWTLLQLHDDHLHSSRYGMGTTFMFLNGQVSLYVIGVTINRHGIVLLMSLKKMLSFYISIN
jgi:hypothetical protein